MPMTPKQMIKLLKKNGFQVVRQTEVPYHSTSLKKGLEQAILKQAGLK